MGRKYVEKRERGTEKKFLRKPVRAYAIFLLIYISTKSNAPRAAFESCTKIRRVILYSFGTLVRRFHGKTIRTNNVLRTYKQLLIDVYPFNIV